MMRIFVREGLGMLLVFHGLANAVMPMRALEAGLPDPWRVVAIAVYQAAILGFIAAGLGVMRVNGFRRIAILAVWVGALAALTSHALLPHGDLWAGVVLSYALPMLTTVFVVTEPETVDRHSRPGAAWHRIAVAGGVAFFVWVSMAAVSWPLTRSWGTTAEDWTQPLPGDRSPRAPEYEVLHAVTIDASPAAVWAWLVQLGQDRAGFYSYDWLERVFGADIRNVNQIRSEWQTRRAGDRVFATQPGYMGGAFGERPGWRVTAAEPNRLLVLENWGTFALIPQEDGRTRLLVRSTISHERIPAWAAALNLAAFELPHFIMQRKMLLGIKARAEQTPT